VSQQSSALQRRLVGCKTNYRWASALLIRDKAQSNGLVPSFCSHLVLCPSRFAWTQNILNDPTSIILKKKASAEGLRGTAENKTNLISKHF